MYNNKTLIKNQITLKYSNGMFVIMVWECRGTFTEENDVCCYEVFN